MEIKNDNTVYLSHFSVNDGYQYGLVKYSGMVFFSLENGMGDKHINGGTHELKLKKVETPLTIKYQKKYPWFSWHIEVQDVTNGKDVYLHIGNTEEDTDLCILIADTCDLTPPTQAGFVGESTPAFKKLYLLLVDRLEEGKKTYIHIDKLN